MLLDRVDFWRRLDWVLPQEEYRQTINGNISKGSWWSTLSELTGKEHQVIELTLFSPPFKSQVDHLVKETIDPFLHLSSPVGFFCCRHFLLAAAATVNRTIA